MIELFEKNTLKVLTLFSLSPGSKLKRKIIREKTGINNIILNKTLYLLLNIKFLIKEKSLLSLNFKNEDTKKIIDLLSENYNKLKQLPLKEYFMILDINEEFSKIKNIGDVYLFGSYSKLIFKQTSDIDFAIISNEIDKKEVNRMVQKLEKRFNKKIEVHFFTKEFYNNKRDPLVKEIIQQGVKLN